MDYKTIEEAFLFVSSAPPFESSAVVHRITGESFYASELSGDSEIPEDAEESDGYLWIPHKNDLDLGKPLVMEFVRKHCSSLIDEMYEIFRHRGAYGRFKDLLAEQALLEEWYAFEQTRTREALLRWCEENGVVLGAGVIHDK
jgi:hypothetical protein